MLNMIEIRTFEKPVQTLNICISKESCDKTVKGLALSCTRMKLLPKFSANGWTWGTLISSLYLSAVNDPFHIKTNFVRILNCMPPQTITDLSSYLSNSRMLLDANRPHNFCKTRTRQTFSFRWNLDSSKNVPIFIILTKRFLVCVVVIDFF